MVARMADERAKVSVTPRASDGAAEVPVRANDPMTVVIFGASGDLAKRKLVPALYQLEKAGFLPEKYAVVGFSRTDMSDDAYRDGMLTALKELGGEKEAKASDKLVRSLYYQAGNNDDAASFQKLRARLEEIEKKNGLPGNRLFYLSVSPEFFPVIIEQLGAAGLTAQDDKRWSRVIIEKPFGRDLNSARDLSKTVTSVLEESQIYRIDHYLGKETVQNILSFRFGNSMFEPLFNQKYVDNVQITVSETLGMEGKRGAYYDTAGTLRDMVQNHMLQTLTLVAMEPPSSMDSTSIRDEKVKIVRALSPMTAEEVAKNTVRAQYASGKDAKGAAAKAYLDEEGVKKGSQTESYVALKLHLDTWRWAGVPFLLRSGKRLGKRVSEIAVQFKQPPLRLFRPVNRVDDMDAHIDPHANVLVLRIQPDEGIRMSFACKMPGMKIQLADVDMDFTYKSSFTQRSPEAYERLLLDALRGDPSLFTRSDEVEYAWRFITSIHEGWATGAPKMSSYDPFSDGPKDADRLTANTNATWRPFSLM